MVVTHDKLEYMIVSEMLNETGFVGLLPATISKLKKLKSGFLQFFGRLLFLRAISSVFFLNPHSRIGKDALGLGLPL